jgi:DNA-directed RNA polymerase subunit RPC12/RpoP
MEVMKYKNRYCGMRIIMRLRLGTLQRVKTVKMLARDVCLRTYV